MARAATTADAFNAVGDPTRRAILDALAARERSVAELAAALEAPQPQVSKHLGVLRRVDLVTWRRAGRQRLYRIDRAGLRPLQSWLGDLTEQVNAHYDRLDDYLQQMGADEDAAQTEE